MRLLVALAFLCCCACVRAEDWVPPENPDPQAILQEAQSDARAGRYEQALAKHVWFHENALSINPALYGVRLSFALAYWRELAQHYPPATAKLKELRDQAAEQVMKGRKVQQTFHDLTALNQTLGDASLTQKTFEKLDREHPEAAKEVFSLAQPALIQGKAYELCGKYVNAEEDLARSIESYHAMKKLAQNPRFRGLENDFANKKFANDASTLVAILAINHKQAEAEKIARVARKEWDDARFQMALDDALKGVVPEPWP